MGIRRLKPFPRLALDRKASGPGRLRSLEVLRAVAALLVVLYHTQIICQLHSGRIPFGNAFGTGSRGVDLFFVLSGFIIAHVHGDDVGRPDRLPGYAFNRVARIYPAVWIMTALAIGLYALGFGGTDKAAKLAPGAVVASALLLPQAGNALVNVTWTLTYEVFFYALFAVLVAQRRAGLILLLLWQAATAVTALTGAGDGPDYYLRPICLEFGVGLACAWWLRLATGQVRRPLTWFVFLAAGIAGFLGGLAMDAARGQGGVLCALGSGATVLSLARLEQSGRLRLPGPLVLLGEASYAIYMVHFSCLTLLAVVLAREGVPFTDAVCLAGAACSVVAGLAFDRIADRPIQRWLRRRKPELLGVRWGGGVTGRRQRTVAVEPGVGAGK